MKSLRKSDSLTEPQVIQFIKFDFNNMILYCVTYKVCENVFLIQSSYHIE